MGKKRKKNKESAYWKYPAVKDYQLEYNKLYYLANREKIIAEQKKRNKENESLIRKYQAMYYMDNRDRLLDNAKKRNKKK